MSPMEVQTDATSLVRQAHMTAAEYLGKAVEEIDAVFGEGHAKRNPDLVAAFMKTAATDFNTAGILSGAQHIAEALHRIAESHGD